MPLQEFDEQVPVNLICVFNDAWNPAIGFLFAFPIARTQRWDLVLGSNCDAVDHDVSVHVYDEQDAYRKPVGSVTIPAGAGYGAVPPVDVLGQLLAATGRGLVLANGHGLELFIDAAPGTGNVVSVWVQGGYV